MRLLIIEDDVDLCEAMAFGLKKEGYMTDFCNTGQDAMFYMEKETYDAILLDRMLPVKDGLSLLQEIRRKGINTPVIMVTAMGGLNDRIDGLDSGADDYIIKPFAMKELMARIRALLRRPRQIEDREILSFGDFTLDVSEQILKGKSKEYSLSRKETALLEMFLINKGQTLPREQILLRVWGPDSMVEEGNIDNYIFFIRRRLRSVGSHAVIKTVHGVGYRMEEGG